MFRVLYSTCAITGMVRVLVISLLSASSLAHRQESKDASKASVFCPAFFNSDWGGTPPKTFPGNWSRVGTDVLQALAAKWPRKYKKLWGPSSTTFDLQNPKDWLLESPNPAQVPEFNAETLSGLNLNLKGMICTEGADCDKDWGLRTCPTVDTKCAGGGLCQVMNSTITRPGEKPKFLCAPPANFLLNKIHGIVAHAKSFVDIANLEPPDDEFRVAFASALAYLANKWDGKATPIQVRMLFGYDPSNAGMDVWAVLTGLTNKFDCKTQKGSGNKQIVCPGVVITLALARRGLTHWDHGKIVAADGTRALIGGMNWFTKDYLSDDPVSDIDLYVEGNAALGAHRYCEELWSKLCEALNSGVSDFHGELAYYEPRLYKNLKKAIPAERFVPKSATLGRMLNMTAKNGLPPRKTWDSNIATKVKTPDTTTGVIYLGRIGIDDGGPADVAIEHLLASAKDSLKLSQQDIIFSSGLGVVDERVETNRAVWINALCTSAKRGAQVQIMISKTGWVPGPSWNQKRKFSVSNIKGWYSSMRAEKLHAYGLVDKDKVRELLLKSGCPSDKLDIEYAFEGSVKGGWGNHAKFIMVDDMAFYIGSQNLYPCDLDEFGMLVDNAEAASVALREYWEQMWKATKGEK